MSENDKKDDSVRNSTSISPTLTERRAARQEHMLKNLQAAGKAANLPTYSKLSAEQKEQVLDDLKEHLEVTKPTNKLSHKEMADQLGSEMVESIKKRPPVH